MLKSAKIAKMQPGRFELPIFTLILKELKKQTYKREALTDLATVAEAAEEPRKEYMTLSHTRPACSIGAVPTWPGHDNRRLRHKSHTWRMSRREKREF